MPLYLYYALFVPSGSCKHLGDHQQTSVSRIKSPCLSRFLSPFNWTFPPFIANKAQQSTFGHWLMWLFISAVCSHDLVSSCEHNVHERVLIRVFVSPLEFSFWIQWPTFLRGPTTKALYWLQSRNTHHNSWNSRLSLQVRVFQRCVPFQLKPA